MKKTICALTVLAALLLSMCGCGEYTSHYKAVGFIHSNESESAFMNFYEFEGTMVFKLKNKDGGALEYSARLDSGEAEISYDCGNGKTALCTVREGDDFSFKTFPLTLGTLYVIVETSVKCKSGELKFAVG